MSKKTIFLIIILVILFAGFLIRNKQVPLVRPSFTPQPVSEIKQPQRIEYNSSTDLKKELETIDPKVQDDDFTP